MPQAPANLQEMPSRRAIGERRQQLHEVATGLFVNDGFAGVSMRQLSDHLGLYPGSLYAHFESKQALLFELIRDPLEELLSETEHRVRCARNVNAAMREFIACHIDFQVHQRHRALLLNLELRCLEPSYRSEVDVLLKRYRECLGSIVSAGIAKGLYRQQSVSASVQAVLGMLCSVAHWFEDGQVLDTHALAEHFDHMIRGALQCSN
ncbi:TetR/AcrR family transcriptional regulator [Pseudomonas citronellolis]|uniref:TetR/AcrR family transcriptional regulator n=1 Tax=Pseudomonas citronellolis TaxID=53408 RepID=A0AAW6P9M6_9PSED|nr:TetR/AcrR family transcriptional regulator [Pseudomonas citronellolis]MDF3843026.1 TetR/AcrR family transcriptional regulator [Pseudomonas citronellolis]